eukprot:13553886-Alexandrium_andersonii.AAC.1
MAGRFCRCFCGAAAEDASSESDCSEGASDAIAGALRLLRCFALVCAAGVLSSSWSSSSASAVASAAAADADAFAAA